MLVYLNAKETKLILEEAERRQIINEKFHRQGARGGPTSGPRAFEAHKLGCYGEYAVAKYLGLEHCCFLEKHPVPGSPDIWNQSLPAGIDVKTRSAKWHDLVIPVDDAPGKIYVMCTFVKGNLEIHGWITGKQACNQVFLRALPGRGKRYVIPKSCLKPIDELQEIVHTFQLIENKKVNAHG